MYLESNKILSSHQFGFRQNRSTDDQLLLTYNDVTEWFDAGFTVVMLLLDFSKAFYVIHHGVLLGMLRAIGVFGRLLDKAFLSARLMRVCVGGAVSDSVAVTSGVPQGSVLGPLLFLVYVNHITKSLQCSYKAFADDYKLYLKTPKHDQFTASTLQQDLDEIDAVSTSWNLKLNPEKCVVMFGRSLSDDDTLYPFVLKILTLVLL